MIPNLNEAFAPEPSIPRMPVFESHVAPSTFSFRLGEVVPMPTLPELKLILTNEFVPDQELPMFRIPPTADKLPFVTPPSEEKSIACHEPVVWKYAAFVGATD